MIQWCHAFLPRLARGSGPVGAVDFRVDGVVGVADGEDPVVGVGEDGGQRLGGALPRPAVMETFVHYVMHFQDECQSTIT